MDDFTINDKGKVYERLSLLDNIVYKGKYYFVSNAFFMDNDGTQVVKIIRIADLHSNRRKRPSITVRADECKIIIEGNINQPRG